MAKSFLNAPLTNPRLGTRRSERHLAAFEHRAVLEPLAGRVALVPLGRGLAVARADAAADSLPLLRLVNALVDVVQIALECHPAETSDLFLGPQLRQGVDGRLDQVELVGGAEALGQDIA